MDTRFEKVRRHPLCPECGYDLIATVEAGRRICPECGCEFDPSELRPETLPGDWTIARGLRRATTSLLIRAIPALGVWFAFTWFHTAFTRQLGDTIVWITFISVIPGVLIGAILAWKLSSNAGFASRLLVVMAVAVLTLVIAAGSFLVHLLVSPLTSPAVYYTAIAAVCAVGIIIWVHTLES
ncbi:MAG: hypothetical protein JSV91_08655 [Phycisphaerales bacterium]|nr:MAG: hypothetical protein JSV91_08655 [Phycisphaerales bacterium]